MILVFYPLISWKIGRHFRFTWRSKTHPGSFSSPTIQEVSTKHLQHLLGLARIGHITRPGVHRWTVWSTCQGIKGLLQGGITRSHATTAWNQNQMLGTHVHQFLTWFGIKLGQKLDNCTNLEVPGMKGWHLLWDHRCLVWTCLNMVNPRDAR